MLGLEEVKEKFQSVRFSILIFSVIGFPAARVIFANTY
jgi:hypothetical protein